MLHEPAKASGPDNTIGFKTRLGAILFVVYTAIYAGFVLLNVITEGRALQRILPGGLNVAVVYGFGLILVAFILALVYNAVCTARERANNPQPGCSKTKKANGVA